MPLKVDGKSLVWSKEGTSSAEDPEWCVGLASQQTSGWPGTDWIEDILLHQAGPARYTELGYLRPELAGPGGRAGLADLGATARRPLPNVGPSIPDHVVRRHITTGWRAARSARLPGLRLHPRAPKFLGVR